MYVAGGQFERWAAGGESRSHSDRIRIQLSPILPSMCRGYRLWSEWSSLLSLAWMSVVHGLDLADY